MTKAPEGIQLPVLGMESAVQPVTSLPDQYLPKTVGLTYYPAGATKITDLPRSVVGKDPIATAQLIVPRLLTSAAFGVPGVTLQELYVVTRNGTKLSRTAGQNPIASFQHLLTDIAAAAATAVKTADAGRPGLRVAAADGTLIEAPQPATGTTEVPAHISIELPGAQEPDRGDQTSEQTMLISDKPGYHHDMQAGHARAALAALLPARDPQAEQTQPDVQDHPPAPPLLTDEVPDPAKPPATAGAMTEPDQPPEPDDRDQLLADVLRDDEERAAARAAAENRSLPPSGFAQDSVFDDDEDNRPKAKRGLFRRILDGLPGCAASATTVFAAKAGVSALLAGVAPVAIAPIVTTAGALVTGVFVGQSVAHFRERWTQAEADQGRKISLKEVFKGCVKGENIARELKAYKQEVTSRGFWKKAFVKGSLAAGIGAAIGWSPEIFDTVVDKLNSTQTGHAFVQSTSKSFNGAAASASAAYAQASAYVANSSVGKLFRGLNPFGKAAAPAAPPARVAAPVAPAASVPAAAAPAAAPAAEPPAPARVADVPSEAKLPVSASDKVRAILSGHGVSGDKIEKILGRHDASLGQVIKDAAVSRDLALDKATMRDMLRVAADLGNKQAIQDIAFLDGKAPGIVAEPQYPLHAAGVDAESRSAAADFIRANYPGQADAAPAVDAPAPTILQTPAGPVTEADAPVRIGSEAARCVLEQVEKGRSAIRSLCTLFSDAMGKNDTVLIEGKGMGPLVEGQTPGSMTYVNEADQENTQDFMRRARRDFRDTFFVPWMRAEAK